MALKCTGHSRGKLVTCRAEWDYRFVPEMSYDPIKPTENTAAQNRRAQTQNFFFSPNFFSPGKRENCPWAAPVARGARRGGLSLATVALGASGNHSFQFQSPVVSHLDPTSSLWTWGSNEWKITTVKTIACCGWTEPDCVTDGFEQKIEINFIVSVKTSL